MSNQDYEFMKSYNGIDFGIFVRFFVMLRSREDLPQTHNEITRISLYSDFRTNKEDMRGTKGTKFGIEFRDGSRATLDGDKYAESGIA